MALLDEEIIEEWLISKGYFTIRGLKVGIREIDLLAIKNNGEKTEYLHVEAQISFNPVGYAFGNANAAQRTELELKEGAQEYFEKKFTNAPIIQKRNSVMPNVNWEYFFVHAVLREPTETKYLEQLGVKIISYADILNDLLNNNNPHRTSSVAGNIMNIVEYSTDILVSRERLKEEQKRQKLEERIERKMQLSERLATEGDDEFRSRVRLDMQRTEDAKNIWNAIRRKDMAAIKVMIDRGLDLTAVNDDGLTVQQALAKQELQL